MRKENRAKVLGLPVIGVMGSGSREHTEFSTPLGKWIAGQGFHLLSGGDSGVMKAVSEAFVSVMPREGRCIGILPGRIAENGYRPLDGYPNPYVEICIRTHLPLSGQQGTEMLSRNHINVLSADLIIALPGSFGTASEVKLAQRYGKPVIGFFSSREDIEGLENTIEFYSDIERLARAVRKKLNLAT